MRISTRASYGIRICVELALSQKPLSVCKLEHQTDLSLKYMEQILALLKKNELVYAMRGKLGGYTLTRAPEQITVENMLVALEDEITLATNMSNNGSDDFYRAVMRSINTKINEILNAVTLRDLANGFPQDKLYIVDRAL